MSEPFFSSFLRTSKVRGQIFILDNLVSIHEFSFLSQIALISFIDSTAMGPDLDISRKDAKNAKIIIDFLTSMKFINTFFLGELCGFA
jgi:hypothetical protein